MAEEEKKKKNPPTEVLDDDFDDDDEVEDEDEEEEEEAEEEEEESEDLDEEDIDEEEEAEDDGDEEDDSRDDDKDKKSKEKQSKEERARQAQARREREAKERKDREEQIRREAYLKGKLEGNKVNTFTEEPINDEYDLFIFETQKALEKEGKDPIADLPKRLAEINRQKAKEEADEAKKKKDLDEQIDKEFSEFRGKYPNVDLRELLRDPDFADYADGRLGKGGKTLVQLYEAFNNFKKKFGGKSEEEEDTGKKGAPSPNGGRKQKETSYSKMSKEDKIKELRRQGLID